MIAGATQGDHVLVAIAGVLQDELRGAGARHGGEEFFAILPGAGPDQAFDVAERLRLRIGHLRIPMGSTTIGVTASVGVATWDARESADALVARADAAMYAAKAAGRNCCVAASRPMTEGEASRRSHSAAGAVAVDAGQPAPHRLHTVFAKLTQIRWRAGPAAQTGPDENTAFPEGGPTVKDLRTYALCYAALLGAALAIAGLVASTRDPAPPVGQAVAVHAAQTNPNSTMNIPF